MRDLLLQYTEPRTLRRMFKNIGHGLESSRTGDERMQSGSSSQSGPNRGDVEIREDQLKRIWTQAGSSS